MIVTGFLQPPCGVLVQPISVTLWISAQTVLDIAHFGSLPQGACILAGETDLSQVTGDDGIATEDDMVLGTSQQGLSNVSLCTSAGDLGFAGCSQDLHEQKRARENLPATSSKYALCLMPEISSVWFTK